MIYRWNSDKIGIETGFQGEPNSDENSDFSDLQVIPVDPPKSDGIVAFGREKTTFRKVAVCVEFL